MKKVIRPKFTRFQLVFLSGIPKQSHYYYNDKFAFVDYTYCQLFGHNHEERDLGFTRYGIWVLNKNKTKVLGHSSWHHEQYMRAMGPTDLQELEKNKALCEEYEGHAL